MSNKRIDLTQYEGHTKGDPNDNPDSWRVVGDGYVMNGTHPQPRYIGYIRHSNFEPDIPAKREPLSEADANLIADGPLFLAELKRCYERLDKADEVMLKAREVLMKHHEWMSVNDATSEEDDQEILDVVKDLREASE